MNRLSSAKEVSLSPFLFPKCNMEKAKFSDAMKMCSLLFVRKGVLSYSDEKLYMILF